MKNPKSKKRPAEVGVLRKRIRRLEQEVEYHLSVRQATASRLEEVGKKLDQFQATRAGRLLIKGKYFIVVACDEPYFPEVYRRIRQHEAGVLGRWTDEDERVYLRSVQTWSQDVPWNNPQWKNWVLADK